MPPCSFCGISKIYSFSLAKQNFQTNFDTLVRSLEKHFVSILQSGSSKGVSKLWVLRVLQIRRLSETTFFTAPFLFQMPQAFFSPFQFQNTLKDFGHPLLWDGRHQTPMILMHMLMRSAERTWFYSSRADVTQATSGSAPQGSLFYVEKSCPNALHISKCHFGHFPSVIFVHLSLSFLIFYHESRHGNGLCQYRMKTN